MSRWLPWAALLAGAALLAAALLGGDDASLPRVEAVEARADLAAEGHRFGDRLEGRVEVLVPERRVDPDTVTLDADFAPYELAAPPAVERAGDGETTLVRYELVLECLSHECLPRSVGDGGLLLAPATIDYAEASGRRGTVSVGWEPVPSGSWLGGDAEELLGWRADLDPLPGVDYRVPPRLLALLLLALALACAAGSLALLLPRLREALPDAPAGADESTVLGRALAAVRSAASEDDPGERRRALDFLARELRARTRRTDARAARRLAWSRRAPQAGDMLQLADRVEGAGE